MKPFFNGIHLTLENWQGNRRLDPSISGEYTRFLIANWDGEGGDNTLDSRLDEIDVKVESMKRTAFETKSTVSKKANKLDDLKKKNLSLN